MDKSLRLFTVMMLAWSQVVAGSASGEEVRLVAMASCTRKFCQADQPCCNSCRHVGWRLEDDSSSKTTVRASKIELPTCRPNGCGRCSFALAASGFKQGNTFVVSGWRVE